ncbi:MAG: phosphatidate cytidylyltransferase [Flammeovirgaceae bacterium]|nr:phosphatidate cytidylyltransferase [Flammeovirgaceae bacterium]
MLPQKTFGTLCGIAIFCLSFFIERGDISYRYYFLIFPTVSFVYMIKLYKKFERAFGDLVESLLKRSIEIKDSGDSLPGHGGFLDRFDGLLISTPFIVAFLEIF